MEDGRHRRVERAAYAPRGRRGAHVRQRQGRLGLTEAGATGYILRRLYSWNAPARLGIGQALVRRLTERHGGRVTVASEGINRGTTVTLRFPLATTPARARETEPAPLPVDLEGISVLVVDDQPDSREATIEILERMGAAVAGANGGAEALQLTRRAGFDAVPYDLNMPGMDAHIDKPSDNDLLIAAIHDGVEHRT